MTNVAQHTGSDKTPIRPFHVNVLEAELTELRRRATPGSANRAGNPKGHSMANMVFGSFSRKKMTSATGPTPGIYSIPLKLSSYYNYMPDMDTSCGTSF
jgi:hypothetical protein